MGKYIYMLTGKGLTRKHQTNSIVEKSIQLIRRNEINIKKKKKSETKGLTKKMFIRLKKRIKKDLG